MKLYPTRGQRFITICYRCHRRLECGDGFESYADPNGPAFEAYYCGDCARAIGAVLAGVKADV